MTSPASAHTTNAASRNLPRPHPAPNGLPVAAAWPRMTDRDEQAAHLAPQAAHNADSVSLATACRWTVRRVQNVQFYLLTLLPDVAVSRHSVRGAIKDGRACYLCMRLNRPPCSGSGFDGEAAECRPGEPEKDGRRGEGADASPHSAANSRPQRPDLVHTAQPDTYCLTSLAAKTILIT